MVNKYIIAAIFAIFLVFLSYVGNFYFYLKYPVSSDTAVWAQLGDYVGGLLSPILSFLSLVLLIKSLTLQNDANNSLREELKNSKKTEKLRSFESQFFNMINSQKLAFENFKIDFNSKGKTYTKSGVEAVLEIEDLVEGMRGQSVSDAEISDFLEAVDEKDQIFGMTRVFYIMAKMISEKLNEDEGFTENDRKSHYHTLINFTDFTLLRLIIMSTQFMNFHSVKFLRGDKEFVSVLKEVGLELDPY